FQDSVAQFMGFNDTKRFSAPEIMMRLYYKKAKVISGALARIMSISGRRYVHFPLNLSIKRISNDFYIAKNEITVKDEGIFRDVDKIMEAFHIYSVSGRKLSYKVKEIIKGRSILISRKSRPSRKSVSFFFGILNGGRVYETLREMQETGVLDRFIPEFGRLRHLVIYEIYHRYTVDEHSLIAVKNLELLKNPRQAKLSYLTDILKRSRQDILYLAILLHDIGKGAYGGHKGNHEDAGYKMLKTIMERFGIEHQDRSRIEFLVRNHVVLSKLALARDNEAPETVTQLAEIVENEENLDALYLITYADMTAVNPDFWTDWKAYLFYDLYTKTMDHLHGIRAGRYKTSDREVQEFIESMPDRYVISTTTDIMHADCLLASQVEKELLAIVVNKRTDGTAEITIATNDQPGLFSKIVGVLTCKGLNILRARIYTSQNALALDKVLLSNWSSVFWEGLEEELKNDFHSAILLGAPICPERGIVKRTFGGKRLESFIEIDNETSLTHSLLELLLPDRIGLLFDIAKQLFQHGVSITSAVINTQEGVAQDVFYLQRNGAKLTTDFVLSVMGALYDSEIEQEKQMTG
ncbi:MAG: HD domain-containing protein, partial [Nitrospirae bacterium]|nr:HD domain-containing protein [Nitrospirota bacterium]